MKFRICSFDHPIVIYRQPYGNKEIAEIGERISDRFCVLSHGEIIYRGDLFPEAERAMVKECKKHHDNGQRHSGRMHLGKHKIVTKKLVRNKQKRNGG
ncbi:MAG: hypothetical protein HOE45_11520 [Gammaproteobacteria bacterium]|jgi:hypothetical protein|nr:hypothetical protein [Gammaproteobacteria bacterium]